MTAPFDPKEERSRRNPALNRGRILRDRPVLKRGGHLRIKSSFNAP